MAEDAASPVGRRRAGWLLRWGTALACAALLGLMALGRVAGVGCAGREGPAPLPALEGATTRPASAGEDLMAGSWAGTWTSSKGEMSGALRCRVEPAAGGTVGAYTATFDAVFAKVFSHRSTVTLSVQRKGEAWEFTGREDLGMLKGGVYTYQGRSDGTEFLCTYASGMDSGTFRMRRTTPATAPAP